MEVHLKTYTSLVVRIYFAPSGNSPHGRAGTQQPAAEQTGCRTRQTEASSSGGQ